MLSCPRGYSKPSIMFGSEFVAPEQVVRFHAPDRPVEGIAAMPITFP
jgi:hypothetical protein